MQLREFCDLFHFDYGLVRSAVSRGIRPEGLLRSPGSGSHREFTPGQAFHMAIVLTLNVAGMYLPKAGRIATATRKALQPVVEKGWDRFDPFNHKLETRWKWRLEIINTSLVRISTMAQPQRGWYVGPWSNLSGKPRTLTQDPIVVIHVNLGQIADVIHKAFRCDKFNLKPKEIASGEVTTRPVQETPEPGDSQGPEVQDVGREASPVPDHGG